MDHRRLFATLPLAALSLAGCRTEETTVARSNARPPILKPQASASPAQETKGTATGKVVGADGKPVAGATVWVTASYNGIRRYEEIFTAVTDATGTYRVAGLPDVQKHKAYLGSEDGMEMFVDVVIAGRPPAHIDFKAMGNETIAPDLILPSQGASLSVRVQNEAGQPIANAIVQVSTGEYRQWAYHMGGDSKKNVDTLDRMLQPRTKTDASGTARFDVLLPGRYTVRLVQSTPETDPNSAAFDSADYFRRGANAAGKTTAQSVGVPVMPGRENRYTVRLQTARGRFLVRYRLPDGTLYSGEGASLSMPEASHPEQPRNEGGMSGGGSKAESVFDFSWGMQSGIRRVSTRLRVEPPHQSASDEPFLWCQTIVAYSPYWKRDAPLVLPVHRVEAGGLRVRVRDENNKPVAGIVVAQSSPFPDENGKNPHKTDADGYATFTGLPSGELSVNVVEPPLLPERKYGTPVVFPDEETLRNRRVWRIQRFVIERGKRTEGLLKAERIGFVRGTVTGGTQGYFVEAEFPSGLNFRQYYDTRTGEYLIGPVAAGAYPLDYRGETGGYKATVTVPNGVLKRDFVAEPRSAESSKKRRENDNKIASLVGTVLLPDGITPALNASVWITDDNDLYPRFGFVADATGRVRLSGRASRGVPSDLFHNRYPPLMPPGGPKERVLVAFLPGSHGATVLPFPPGAEAKPVRLTLPAATAMSGTVTVGGQPLSTVPGFARVRATPVGQGQITDLLAVETTAQADGSFTLAGLTPGVTYGVQASLENVYVSPEVRVLVPVNMTGDLPEVLLKLPQPGKPVAVSVGKGYADAHATRVEKLPGGSLARQTYPLFYVVDGAGDLRVEGLPAGKWHLRLPDGKTIPVTVAPEVFEKESGDN